MYQHPKILLITECALGDSSTGISRTLANVFDGYPGDRLLILNSKEGLEREKSRGNYQMEHFAEYRFGKIGRCFSELNRTLLDFMPLNCLSALEQFGPDVIVHCTNSLACLIVGKRVIDHLGVPSVQYLMDDWRDYDGIEWFGGSAVETISSLLEAASGWIAVSEALLQVAAEHYGVTHPGSIVAHNPVEFPDSFPERSFDGPMKMVYAGSIWPMQLSGLSVIAKAVGALQHSGVAVELVIHTSQDFWNESRSHLEFPGVSFGGFVPYAGLQDRLQEYHLGVVTSSFEESHRHLAEGSVQTKLTDYMAAGLAILACGPVYAACNQFTKKWCCGTCIESQDIASAAQDIQEYLQNRQLLLGQAQTGFSVAAQHFSKAVVQSAVYKFLTECARSK